MSARSEHPIFAHCFDRLSHVMESTVGKHRDALLAALSGRVVEVGAGNGINFGHYPPQVTEIVAVEPEPYLRAKAQAAAERAPIPITVHNALADGLPLEDRSCDAAVACLVLCTVPDQGAALAELARVLKPGGELRFLEHVRSDRPRQARVQQRLDRWGVWPRVGGGCHCSRDTVAAIRAAGFDIDAMYEFQLGPSWMVTSRHVRGRAQMGGAPAGA